MKEDIKQEVTNDIIVSRLNKFRDMNTAIPVTLNDTKDYFYIKLADEHTVVLSKDGEEVTLSLVDLIEASPDIASSNMDNVAFG